MYMRNKWELESESQLHLHETKTVQPLLASMKEAVGESQQLTIPLENNLKFETLYSLSPEDETAQQRWEYLALTRCSSDAMYEVKPGERLEEKIIEVEASWN